MRDLRNAVLNFDVDEYVNPWLPPSPIKKLPWPVSHFLGYRELPAVKVNNLLVWTWSFIGAFCGIALIEGVYRSSSVIQSWNPPIVIGSFGAAAILEYNTIESPLSQPRNLIFGQFLSALIGVCITKLFHLLPEAQFEDLRWLAGALAVGASSFVMSMTKTLHPPAGATALLAATDPGLSELGWYLLPLILIACALMLGSALVVNNIQRQFPQHWWTPGEVGTKLWRQKATEMKPEPALAEKKGSDSLASESTVVSSTGLCPVKDVRSASSLSERQADPTEYKHYEPEIYLTGEMIHVPEWMELDDWQGQVLRALQEKMRQVHAGGCPNEDV